jgi:hypothetical protein
VGKKAKGHSRFSSHYKRGLLRSMAMGPFWSMVRLSATTTRSPLSAGSGSCILVYRCADRVLGRLGRLEHPRDHEQGELLELGIKVVLVDGMVENTISAIVNAAKTGKIGDGKVFVYSIEEAIRIRTDETSEKAI